MEPYISSDCQNELINKKENLSAKDLLASMIKTLLLTLQTVIWIRSFVAQEKQKEMVIFYILWK